MLPQDPPTFPTVLTGYFMPDQHARAEAAFMELLTNPHETWLMSYGFTYEPMIEALLKAHSEGVKLHLYLDHTQSAGTAEKPQVKRLVDAGIDVSIGTSTIGGNISHTKSLIVKMPDGTRRCMSGSVNFSQNGWLQCNHLFEFDGEIWADFFLTQFNELRDFAWAKQKAYQLYDTPRFVVDKVEVTQTTVTANDGQVQVEVEQTQTKVTVTPVEQQGTGGS